jgi:hypothetical protein
MNYFTAVETLRDFDKQDLILDPATKADLMTRIGVLGSPGFGAGGFLRSPLATNNAPDVQVTLYPTVSICFSDFRMMVCVDVMSFPTG